MKIIRNKFIPFPGYKAINLFGILFVRGNATIDDRTLRHESIHTSQMKEMLYVPFYLWYVVEWVVRLFMKGNAYQNISFEREAYGNESNGSYLDSRRPFAWLEYLRDKGILKKMSNLQTDNEDEHLIKVLDDGFVWLTVSRRQAKLIWDAEIFSLYILYSDGSESLIETEDDFISAESRGLDIGIGVGFI